MKYSRIVVLSLIAAAMLSGCGKTSTPSSVLSPSLDSSAPATPENISVQTDPGSGGGRLTWVASSSPTVAGYEVFAYSPDPSRDNSYTLIYTADPTVTSYTMAPASQKTTRYFRLRTVASDGNHSAFSPVVAAVLNPHGQINTPGAPGRQLFDN